MTDRWEIRKYVLALNFKPQALHIPVGARFLQFASQHNEPALWVLVDTTAPKVWRRFVLCGTGLVPESVAVEAPYLGTAALHDGDLVLYLFALPSLVNSQDEEPSDAK